MNPYAKLPSVKYFTGVDGIIEIFEDVFSGNYDCLYGALEISEDMDNDIQKYVQEIYVPKRIKQ